MRPEVVIQRRVPEARVELARGCPRWILSRPPARHHRPSKCTTHSIRRDFPLSAPSRCCQVLHLMVDGGGILKSIPNSNLVPLLFSACSLSQGDHHAGTRVQDYRAGRLIRGRRGGRRAERSHQGIANAAELRRFEVMETRGHIEGGRVAHLAGDTQDWLYP